MIDTILRISERGEGVTGEGRYAALAATGDTLASDGRVIPGPHHQTPPCRHFPACGGCQLQHLDSTSYADFVTDRIVSALDGQGLFANLRAPIVSPPRSRRRATLHAEIKAGCVSMGFSAAHSHGILDMRECHILRPELFGLVAPLRTLLQRLGFKRRSDVHLTLADQGVDVLVTGLKAEGLAAAEAINAFCERHRVARFAIENGHGPETRWEPDAVTVTLGGAPVPLPPAAFLQPTREGESALIAAVCESIGGAGFVADLFAGLGTFAFALPRASRVYAAEGDRSALMALKAGAGRAQRQIFAELRDLYRRPLTAVELDRFQAAVIDPPRAGAREQIVGLASSRLPKLAYVSCNPASFARDAKMLCEAGWRIDWIQPVGQFGWSTHVELAASLSRQ